MKMRETIDLHCLTDMGGPKGKLPYSAKENKNPLMTTHINHVADEARRIKKDDGEHVFMTEDYKPWNDGYKSLIYHGLAGPSKKTTIITDKDGDKSVFVEKNG